MEALFNNIRGPSAQNAIFSHNMTFLIPDDPAHHWGKKGQSRAKIETPRFTGSNDWRALVRKILDMRFPIMFGYRILNAERVRMRG